MSRILVPTRGPEDWRRLLADPEKHWRDGYSAKALAECWQHTDGFPPAVRDALQHSPHACFRGCELLLGVPEYQVPLPGGATASQTDLFALAKSQAGLIAIAVEGKVNEPFGPLVSELEQTPGRQQRLHYLHEELGLVGVDLSTTRYQLLHRTVSALRLANDFTAGTALMLVHSFSPENRWFEHFAAFLAFFGAKAEMNGIAFLARQGKVDLYAGWVKGC